MPSGHVASSPRCTELCPGVDLGAVRGQPAASEALLKAVEIIGERAAMVSNETRAAHPEIPWSEVIGMRHRLVHGYFEVDLMKVWDTVHRDLPALSMLIEPLVPPEED